MKLSSPCLGNIQYNAFYSHQYVWPGWSYPSYQPQPITLSGHFHPYRRLSPVHRPYSSFTTHSGDPRTSRAWSNFHSGQNNFLSYARPKYGESDI